MKAKAAQLKSRKIDILVFGDDGAGKRTFMEQFTNKDVSKDTQVSKTCKTEYLRKTVEMPGSNQKAVVRLWRQTAQERPFTTRLFREADCAIYIADLTCGVEKTKQKVTNLNRILARECRDNVVKVLVGNKLDLEKTR